MVCFLNLIHDSRRLHRFPDPGPIRGMTLDNLLDVLMGNRCDERREESVAISRYRRDAFSAYVPPNLMELEGIYFQLLLRSLLLMRLRYRTH